ncbi:MAG: hypothetical protein IJG97_02640 [Bacilli bacterium]|nr:hypothetical protein [Bacilli bacterium]
MAYKRRLRFDKRIKFQKKMNIIYILLLVVLASIGTGYAYIKSNLNINGTANVTAASWDVHFENLQVTTDSVTATTPASITDDTTVEFSAELAEPNDFYEFTVDVANEGTMDAMIDSFSISPILTTAQAKYLEYTVSYSDGVPLASKQELKANTSETLKVRFSYIENSDKTNYPTEDQSFNIEFSMDYIQADGSEIAVGHPSDFATDSWDTIVNAIRNNNTNVYNVGDTKTVDMGSLGTHTLRIANKSIPSECSTTGFSQTACGFVLEFADIITTHIMNPWDGVTTPGNGNIGGWPASEMRTYVNSDIYNALPEELRNGIIDTTVVSGHGNTAGETNFTSTDKLYLLSSHEVWEDADGNTSSGLNYYDTAYNNTRQLDYYSSQNVTTSSYAGAIKQINGSNDYWWLRSARSDWNSVFLYVNRVGWWNSSCDFNGGVSPAFRIG